MIYAAWCEMKFIDYSELIAGRKISDEEIEMVKKIADESGRPVVLDVQEQQNATINKLLDELRIKDICLAKMWQILEFPDSNIYLSPANVERLRRLVMGATGGLRDIE